MSKRKKKRPWRTGISVSMAAARKHEREDAALQHKFDRLAGPVTVRSINDPKPDTKEN